MTSVLCSLPKHLSLFTISSWYLAAGGLLWCSHFAALPPHVSPPFLVDYSFNLLKAKASVGRSNRSGGMGWGMQGSSWHLQMLWVQWNMGAIFQHVWGCACTCLDTHIHLPHTHNSEGAHCHQSAGVRCTRVHVLFACGCIRGGLHGWVCVHLWHQLDRLLIASRVHDAAFFCRRWRTHKRS